MRERGTGGDRGGRRTGEIMRGAQRGKQGRNNTDRQKETNMHKRESTEGRTQETLKGHKRAWKSQHIRHEDTTQQHEI